MRCESIPGERTGRKICMTADKYKECQKNSLEGMYGEDEVGDESLVSQQSHCSFRGTCHREDWDLEAGGLCSVP